MSIPSLREVARTLGGDVSGTYQVMAPGPDHSPQDRSLSVRVAQEHPEGFIVHSFAGDDDMACRQYVREKLGLPEWKPEEPRLKTVGEIVAEYDYCDETGDLLFQVVRFEPKDFRQRRPLGGGKWAWEIRGVARVPYRLPGLIAGVKEGRTIYITEGEKAADSLTVLGVATTCSPHGAGKWRDEYSAYLKDADVVILPDNDKPGEQHAAMVANSLRGVAKRVRLLRLAGIPSGGDVYDWLEAGGNADELAQAAKLADEYRPEPKGRLRPFCIHDLLILDIPPREMLLDPIIPEKGLAMVYATRGTGKTHLACGSSFAVATGTKFLKWNAPTARRVLHCDGEMAAAELRDRFRQIMDGSQVKLEPGMLNILTADLLEFGIGNLASPAVQAEMEPLLDGVELLVLDNLSSLTAVIRDNDAESWNPIQEWLLRLRRRGTSVLIVHHAGKGGEQRGTSRREDVLDTSISLRRPSDFVQEEGARFEIHYEKVRGVYGNKIKPFEARMETRDGAALWTLREIEDVNMARVRALLDDELSIRDIADETGLSKSTVHRLKKKIEEEARDWKEAV